jgi:DNA-binding transcriptional regulator YiaG
LAKELGVSATTLSYWESGKRTPSDIHTAKYLNLLDLLSQATQDPA